MQQRSRLRGKPDKPRRTRGFLDTATASDAVMVEMGRGRGPSIGRETKGTSPRNGSVFGTRGSGCIRTWKRAYAKEARSIINREMDHDLAFALQKRLDSFMRCGATIRVRSCGICQTDRPGSGTFEGVKRTCKTKGCQYCGWTRSKRTGDFMERAYDAVPEVEGYQWQYIVQTIKYDPRDEDAVTWQALRERAFIADKLRKKLWAKLMKVKGAALFATIECGDRGHVHLNLIYYGPPMDRDDVERVASAVDCAAGLANIQDIDQDPAQGPDRKKCGEKKGSRKGLRKASEYVAKGARGGKHSRKEAWLGDGDSVVNVTDARLMARWDRATYKFRLTERCGALRGLEFDAYGQTDTSAPVNDSREPCECCGVVGIWLNRYVRTFDWIQSCQAKNKTAMVRTDWRPPPDH